MNLQEKLVGRAELIMWLLQDNITIVPMVRTDSNAPTPGLGAEYDCHIT